MNMNCNLKLKAIPKKINEGTYFSFIKYNNDKITKLEYIESHCPHKAPLSITVGKNSTTQ